VDLSLASVLSESRSLGFLGPGDPDVHLRHSEEFVRVAERALGGPPTSFVDLGTGGGVPGLVLATAWPDARGILVESSSRRSAALRAWAGELRLDLAVVEARAEDVAHDPAFRQRFDLVTARSFASPAATAEIAAGLVVVGGVAVVSEPPGGDALRWPAGQLGDLGFGPASLQVGDATFVVLPKERACPPGVPRRRGQAVKRPRW